MGVSQKWKRRERRERTQERGEEGRQDGGLAEEGATAPAVPALLHANRFPEQLRRLHPRGATSRLRLAFRPRRPAKKIPLPRSNTHTRTEGVQPNRPASAARDAPAARARRSVAGPAHRARRRRRSESSRITATRPASAAGSAPGGTVKPVSPSLRRGRRGREWGRGGKGRGGGGEGRRGEGRGGRSAQPSGGQTLKPVTQVRSEHGRGGRGDCDVVLHDEGGDH